MGSSLFLTDLLSQRSFRLEAGADRLERLAHFENSVRVLFRQMRQFRNLLCMSKVFMRVMPPNDSTQPGPQEATLANRRRSLSA